MILGKLQMRNIMMMGKNMAAKLSSFLLSKPMFLGFSLLLQLMSFSIEFRERMVEGLISLIDGRPAK
jgi:hypothetical protein